MKRTGQISLCGIVAGMGVVIMLLSAIMPSMTYALPMVAGGLLIVPSIEFGSRTALTTYAATGILSLILPADKEAALFYILLFGIYPIIKKGFEKIKKPWLEYTVKFAYFNAVAALGVWLAAKVLGIPFEADPFGKWAVPAMLLLGNVCFIVYDITLTRFIPLYVARLQPVLHKTFHI